ncbi:MAG: lysine exporter LysO family protein [Desulfurococcales archaeon]|nr:lysine exporter LysO family protein [Desulfurococcales archaeon]
MGAKAGIAKIATAYSVGAILGVRGLGGPLPGLLEPALYAMLFAVGVSLGLERGLGRLLARRGPSGILLGGGVLLAGALAGYLVGLVRGLDPWLSAASAAGSGWYSFTGPVIAEYDAYLGFVAFAANVLRELLTLVLYPILARCCPLQAVSLGGATAMDSTLPVIARYGGPDAALLGLVQGLFVTLTVPIIVPVLAAL